MTPVWAAVPVKRFEGAKQRLSGLLTPAQRAELAATMLEDVLSALAGARQVAGIIVNTLDPHAAALARRYGARVVAESAAEGHTAAVQGMARVLLAERLGALLTVPGDVPGVIAAEIDAVVASCSEPPSLTLATSRAAAGPDRAVRKMPPPESPEHT